MSTRFRSLHFFMLTGFLTAAPGCFQKTAAVQSPQNAVVDLQRKMVENHAEGVYQAWRSTHQHAKKLQNAITVFLDNPTAENMKQAKESWILARTFYSPTEAFRF